MHIQKRDKTKGKGRAQLPSSSNREEERGRTSENFDLARTSSDLVRAHWYAVLVESFPFSASVRSEFNMLEARVWNGELLLCSDLVNLVWYDDEWYVRRKRKSGVIIAGFGWMFLICSSFLIFFYVWSGRFWREKSFCVCAIKVAVTVNFSLTSFWLQLMIA